MREEEHKIRSCVVPNDSTRLVDIALDCEIQLALALQTHFKLDTNEINSINRFKKISGFEDFDLVEVIDELEELEEVEESVEIEEILFDIPDVIDLVEEKIVPIPTVTNTVLPINQRKFHLYQQLIAG